MYSAPILYILSCTFITTTSAKLDQNLNHNSHNRVSPILTKLGTPKPESERNFINLDDVCLDCYNLLNNPEVYTKCRADCYTSDIFKGCVEALLKTEKLDTYKSYIKNICYLNEMTFRYAPKFALRKRLH